MERWRRRSIIPEIALGRPAYVLRINAEKNTVMLGDAEEPVELSLKGYHIILIKPDIFVSTRDAFAEIKDYSIVVNKAYIDMQNQKYVPMRNISSS